MNNSIFGRIKRQLARATKLTARDGNAVRALAFAGMTLALTALFILKFPAAGGAAAENMSVLPASAPAPRAGRTRPPAPELVGYVDMHTHPMSHLGFGKKLMHGAPDIDMIVPKGTHGCNESDFRAKNVNEALGSCNSTHGGWGIDNPCGDTLRMAVINLAADDGFIHIDGLDHPHAGAPDFEHWPHQTSKVHQQMWWEWIKRAHEGGLRVMVALSVNNQLLAKMLNGDSPTTDKESSDKQVNEIKRLVGRHNDFMEVAYSAADLRRIVGAGKLAVILGMEIDDFGNFSQTPIFSQLPQSARELQVKLEIDRIYNLGVRYLFPIHLTNNVFGGTAAYSPLFNFATKYNTGEYFTLEHTSDPSINYSMNLVDGAPNNFFLAGIHAAVQAVGDLGCCGSAADAVKKAITPDWKWDTYNLIPPGHINALGLTPLGKFALKEMMKRGLLIDIDHMGRKSITDALALAEDFRGGYPVNLGHNNIRDSVPDPEHPGTERNISAYTAHRVGKLGGMIGVGTADRTADNFILEYFKMTAAMSNYGEVFVAPGIGTDVNGMESLPKGSFWTPNNTFYQSNNLTKLKMGSPPLQREWDYTKEGVAHYGLMKEFMVDVNTRNLPTGPAVHARLWQSAEYFARMWEKCEDVAGN